MPSAAFELDPFQQRALTALERGSSVLVAAPTGSGKTVVAEAAIERALGLGKRALYASPIKALSNQKYADFGGRYGQARVGILTGDRQENPAAQILVLTAEILHNRLIAGGIDGLQDVATLVFDEFHFLSDPERGPVWEESIILCPKHVQIACLSATLPNVDELAGWLEQHVERLETFVETQRPIPLSFHYFAGGELHSAVDGDGKPDGSLKRFDVRPGRGPSTSLVELLPVLLREQLAPALCFVFSRRDAERFAAAAGEWLADHAPPGPEIDAQVEARLPGLPDCLRQGAGYHHAGMAPELKQVVEQLFSTGALRVLCATETFAVGLNMPARTVVLPRLTKFDGRAHRDLRAREFQQMIGRAGRRGLDTQGHVVLLADPWKPFKDVARLLTSPLEPISSASNHSYNTLLNVTHSYGQEKVASLISGGFQPSVEKARQLDVMRSALAELGYDGPVAKSTLLRGIFDDHALLLAELLDDPRFASSAWDGPEFAEVMSWFVDGSAPRTPSAKLSPRLRRARQLLEDIAGRVQRAERNGGLVVTKAVTPAFPLLICKWCTGHDPAGLCREYNVGQGDLRSLIERTNQLLRQVSRAASKEATYAGLAGLAAAALRAM